MATATTAKRSRPATVLDEMANGDGLCIVIPPSAHTHAGFREWVKSDALPEKLRVTYVDQEIYLDMTKENIQFHAAVKAEICRVLLNLNRQTRRGKLYLDGVLISNTKAKVSNNPDAIFVSRESIEAGLVRFVPQPKEQDVYLEIEGRPDWVLEIVSKSSVYKDTKQLKRAYHKAGIPEYWLVDARGETISFQILHWSKRSYVTAPNKDGWQYSRVFDRWFRLTRERDDMGLWEYTLEMRRA